MKACIVEIRNLRAAVLTKDGRVIKIRNHHYKVGQVLSLNRYLLHPVKNIALTASAAAVLFAVGIWAYFTPYSYVSLDVNPSIEYSLNRFDRVLSADAVNQDGSAVLGNLNLKHKSIGDAVRETVGRIRDAGYFSSADPGSIVLSAASCDSAETASLTKTIQGAAAEACAGTSLPIAIEADGVGLERVAQARSLGTTAGKLNLVQKLEKAEGGTDGFVLQDWLGKPVKEIMKAIKSERTVAENPAPEISASSSAPESGDSSSEAPPSAVDGASSSQSSKAAQKASASVKKSKNKSASGTVRSGVPPADNSQNTQKNQPASGQKSNGTQKLNNQAAQANQENKPQSGSKKSSPQSDNPSSQSSNNSDNDHSNRGKTTDNSNSSNDKHSSKDYGNLNENIAPVS